MRRCCRRRPETKRIIELISKLFPNGKLEREYSESKTTRSAQVPLDSLDALTFVNAFLGLRVGAWDLPYSVITFLSAGCIPRNGKDM